MMDYTRLKELLSAQYSNKDIEIEQLDEYTIGVTIGDISFSMNSSVVTGCVEPPIVLTDVEIGALLYVEIMHQYFTIETNINLKVGKEYLET